MLYVLLAAPFRPIPGSKADSIKSNSFLMYNKIYTPTHRISSSIILTVVLLAPHLPIILTVVLFLIRLLATTTPTPPIIISTLSALHDHAHTHRTSFPTTVLTPRQRQVLDHILDQSSLRHDYPEEADPVEILCARFPALLPNVSDAQRVVRFI